MKRFNEWCDRMDEKLKDFNFQDFLYILFPISIFFKRKQKETSENIVYDVRRGKPIIVQSQKMMTQYEKLYGNNGIGGFKTTTDGFAGTNGTGGFAGANFGIDMIKMGIKREICDEILKSDLFEWSIQETAVGTQVSARIVINKFENN
jgi:hypothetical protein